MYSPWTRAKYATFYPEICALPWIRLEKKAESFMDVNLAKWSYKMERGLFAKSNYASGQACFQPFFLYLRFFHIPCLFQLNIVMN